MQLYSPLALLLLLILPVAAFLMLRKNRTAGITFSTLGNMKKSTVSLRLRLRWTLVAMRLLCLAALIIALARPRKGTVLSNISTEGVAMEVVVDCSGSMQAEMSYKGQTMNRLEVVKRVLNNFIKGDGPLKGRPNDLIGLVTFARYADTICPLIHGHNVLIEFLKSTKIVTRRSEDGTAIGDAIALAAARLKKAEEQIQRRNIKLRSDTGSDSADPDPGFTIKSKVIVLLTDGQSNAGQIQPLQAAQLAKEWGIKIYTIGIGSNQAFGTMQTIMGSFKVPIAQQLDERLLTAIAKNTGGFYAKAASGEQLVKIYKEIDKLEKTKVQSLQYTQYAERFGPFAMAALLLLGLEILAGCTIFRKIP